VTHGPLTISSEVQRYRNTTKQPSHGSKIIASVAERMSLPNTKELKSQKYM